MINLDFREADRYLSKSRRKIEFSSPVLLVEFELKVVGSWNVEPKRRGPCTMAMEIHLLICCILVTALLSLEIYAQFSQISLSLKLNLPNSAYFFKLLSKRSELFTLLFIFSLGLLLDFGKLLSDLRSACRLKSSFCNSMAVLHRSNSMLEDSLEILNGDLQLIQDNGDGESDEIGLEDQLFDEMSLRELVKAERQRADMALMELEKERAAAATAAEEALTMILRLQREKSSVEIEANHYRRLAEQKQQYDQQLIDFLRNLVMEQGSVGGRRVSLCSHCQLDINDGFGEGEEDRVTCAMEERFCYEDDDELLSSLEFDSRSL